MCTAATYQTKNFYMGRTLDYEFSYGDEVTITPRNYPFHFRHAGTLSSHYAMIGMAHVAPDNGVDYPLYYDACNEKGVCMAGLNFVGNAAYADIIDTKENVAQFEFIPWILSQCASVSEAKEKLVQMNLVGTVFASHFPAAQLHWMIADKSENIVVESMADGLHIYDNPAGVLTNNPPFPMQMFALNNYAALSSLGSVDQQRGCCEVADGKYEITIYTSCCNADKGIYYYTTYDNHSINGIDMHHENLDSAELIRFAVLDAGGIHWQN